LTEAAEPITNISVFIIQFEGIQGHTMLDVPDMSESLTCCEAGGKIDFNVISIAMELKFMPL